MKLTRFLLSAVALCCAATFALAGVTNVDASGVAVQGYDVVAFFTEAKPVKGAAEFTAQHDGATYRFSSARHRDLFVAAPAKYVPQYGGYCAFGVTKDAKFPIEVETWQVIDGKLYLNKNADVKKKFSEDTAGLIRVADAKWPAVAGK